MSEAVKTITSREFLQDTARAKREADKGPVFITTRGTVSYVLLTKEEFDRRTKDYSATVPRPRRNPIEVLADRSIEGDFSFEIPEFKGKFKGFEFD